jgi:DNA-binding NarL/FixJ family response regulator
MKYPIKILLADDELLFRKGLRFIIEREADIEVLYEAANGKELIDFLKSSRDHPDIIITDLKMPLLNGVQATKLIRKDFPDIKIIALSSYGSKAFVANMIDVGAVSYLVKNASPQELLTTIREVYRIGFYHSSYVKQVIQEIAKENNSKSAYENVLTNREIEVLQLICEQKTTAEIAKKLFLSPRTIDGHRNNLLIKTNAKNSAGLVFYAIQNKLLLIYE